MGSQTGRAPPKAVFFRLLQGKSSGSNPLFLLPDPRLTFCIGNRQFSKLIRSFRSINKKFEPKVFNISLFLCRLPFSKASLAFLAKIKASSARSSQSSTRLSVSFNNSCSFIFSCTSFDFLSLNCCSVISLPARISIKLSIFFKHS